MVGRRSFIYQERQQKGWCGPAVLAMGLASLGFKVNQEELAQVAPYDPNWGTDHRAMLNGAKRFVPESYEISGNSLEELARLAKQNVVIVNFMDTELGREPLHGAGNGEDGHYVLLDKFNENGVFVIDPNPISPVDGGLRRIDQDWFERHFWDIQRNGMVVERWALIIPS